MKILRLKIDDACAERDLLYKTVFEANETTTLTMLPNGHFIVQVKDKPPVLVPHGKVRTAFVELEQKVGK